MKMTGKSIRPFIGSKNYIISRNFYLDLGFKEKLRLKKCHTSVLENSDFIYKMHM